MSIMEYSLVKYTNNTKSFNISTYRGIPSVYINPVDETGKTGKYIFKSMFYRNLCYQLVDAIDKLLQRTMTSDAFLVIQPNIPVPEGQDPATVPNKQYIVTIGVDQDSSYIEFAYFALDGSKNVDRFTLNSTVTVKSLNSTNEWTESPCYHGLRIFKEFLTVYLPMSIAKTRDVSEIKKDLGTTPPKSAEDDDLPVTFS